jgi:hypothetical protein
VFEHPTAEETDKHGELFSLFDFLLTAFLDRAREESQKDLAKILAQNIEIRDSLAELTSDFIQGDFPFRLTRNLNLILPVSYSRKHHIPTKADGVDRAP